MWVLSFLGKWKLRTSIGLHKQHRDPDVALGHLSPRNFLISNKEYLISREERINYLVSCGIDRNILEDNIPNKYNEIEDFIWLDIIKNIIKVLEKEEELLRSSKFNEFNLSGHTEGRRFRPWQMVNDKRM